MMTLPAKIVERVVGEFADSEQADVLRLLTSCAEEGHGTRATGICARILDLAEGELMALQALVEVARSDPRDLFYSSRQDPHVLIDKLLKRLRFVGTMTEAEIDEARTLWRMPGNGNEKAIDYICRTITKCDRSLTDDEQIRIRHIARVMRYPPHSILCLERSAEAARPKPWWKFW